MIVRELNGGLYFGEPRGIETLPDGSERAVDTMVYTTPEIERVLRFAFELARSRQGCVRSVDKSNVLPNRALWRQVETRTEARRGGKGGLRTLRSRWAPDPFKKK